MEPDFLFNKYSWSQTSYFTNINETKLLILQISIEPNFLFYEHSVIFYFNF